MGAVSESASADCFSEVMSSMPGFRFHPTDEELVMYYLKRKICGKKLKFNVIKETDVYKWDPEDLPEQSFLKTGDRQWFFFCHRDRKYPNGGRSSRATRHGYWKATGKDRNVIYNSRSVGVKKTLVFYLGRAPSGERTDWVMHEYTMDEDELRTCRDVKDYYALYKVFKKSGPGPKNGEQYGAPFKEEEWADDDVVDFNVNSVDREVPEAAIDNVIDQHQLQPLFDDEIDEIIKGMLDVEPVLDQQHVNGYVDFPQVADEETRNVVMDQFYEAMVFPDPSEKQQSSSQLYDAQPSFDFNHQSVDSHLCISEAPEVTSTPNIQSGEGLVFYEEGFLEINDLIDTESTFSNTDKLNNDLIENLQFEDVLSEFDPYQDAEMFLCGLGSINEETVSHAYMNNAGSNIENQSYQLLSNPEDVNQTVDEFWMHVERNTRSPAEGYDGSFSLTNPGVVCDSVGFPTESTENQRSTVEDVKTSRLSSALWAFVDSIPTTPASAAENPLVNRALNRMSSFSRVKIKPTDNNIAAVGNIPYDATEEQLKEICREVGPVISFRLVTDRETGKPKGYGFCEYTDEETALSARRNLQGYEINGRQLRVDFAENDKGNDRNKDQGRGGPGMTTNADPQKQVGIPAVQGESTQAAQHQPMGLHIAVTAAAVMTAALGGAQTGIPSNQNGLQSQQALANDPLTLHLAKMSRSQLSEIISELKGMATHNKDLSRQLLLSRPQLPKALFQAQIMLGMVNPQMLQMPNLRQVSDQPSQSLMNEGHLGQTQQTLVPTVAGLPPYGQSKLQFGLTPYIQEGQVSTLPHNPSVPSQLTANPKPPLQPRIPPQHHQSNHFVQPGAGQNNLILPSIRPPTTGNFSARPPFQQANSTVVNQQPHASFLQQPVRVGSSTVSHTIHMVRPDANFQAGPSMPSGVSQLFSKEGDRPSNALEDWAKSSSKYSNISFGVENTGVVHDNPESFTRPSKLTRLNDGRGLSAGTSDVPISNGSSHVLRSSSLPVPAVPKADVRHSDQQSSQLPSDVESVLLQQVLNLTPEQLSSLPPEQQQQVIQLQQALKRDQMQHS